MASYNGAFDTIYNSGPPGDLPEGARRARVGGSTFTVFAWNAKPIGFARQVSHQSAQPVAQGSVPIHPLDSPYPVQLITPQATTMGTITLELYELYNQLVWKRLGDTFSANGIVDLANMFNAVTTSAKPITITRIITPPRINSIRGKGNGTQRGKNAQYVVHFHNCVVSNLDDGETIEIGTMEVTKTVTVNYTHLTRGSDDRNKLLNDQDRSAKATIP